MGKGDKNRESPMGKRAKKRTLRRMDNRNKASILNSRRKRNRRIIDAVVTDHFEMFVGDMDNKAFNKFNGRNSFNDEFVIFVPVVMKGNMRAGVGINTGGSNNRSAKIAANVLRNGGGIAVVGLGVNVEPVAMILIDGRFNFLEERAEFVMEMIKQSGTEGIA